MEVRGRMYRGGPNPRYLDVILMSLENTKIPIVDILVKLFEYTQIFPESQSVNDSGVICLLFKIFHVPLPKTVVIKQWFYGIGSTSDPFYEDASYDAALKEVGRRIQLLQNQKTLHQSATEAKLRQEVTDLKVQLKLLQSQIQPSPETQFHEAK